MDKKITKHRYHYNDVLKMAYELAKSERPSASPAQWAAFADVIAFAIMRQPGGLIEKSVRKEVACRHINFFSSQPPVLKVVCKLFLREDGPIFGPITQEHLHVWQEDFYCDSDDCDSDREMLKNLAQGL